MSGLSQAMSSPLNSEAAVSPLLWGTAPSPSSNNNVFPPSRSTPIAIVRNQEEEDSDSDEDDDGDVVHSFQQLVLESNQADDSQFCVGSLPTAGRRRRMNHQQLGTSLPAAPLLRSTRRSNMSESIPPISLTEGQGQEYSTSPSYGSLRDSQIAGRFLDGPSSYRDKSSGQIKQWQHSRQKVRFQASSVHSTLGERIQEFREQQQQQHQEESPHAEQGGRTNNADEPSSLSAIMSSSLNNPARQSSFVDHEYSLQQEDVLSTSLTGLELLQRGLSIGACEERPPDASHLSSWSSSGANTYDVATSSTDPPQHVANQSSDHENNVSALPADGDEERDDDHDDAPFDLDME